MKQPMNTNRVQTLFQPARRPSQTPQDQPTDQTPEGRPPSQVFISAPPTLNISIPVTTHHHFSSVHFPENLSQSSIQGRSGSNACTLVALTIAKLFYTFPLQSIDPTASGMLIGSQNYDRVTKGVPQYFTVREGVSNLSFLGSVTIGTPCQHHGRDCSISLPPTPLKALT